MLHSFVLASTFFFAPLIPNLLECSKIPPISGLFPCHFMIVFSSLLNHMVSFVCGSSPYRDLQGARAPTAPKKYVVIIKTFIIVLNDHLAE